MDVPTQAGGVDDGSEVVGAGCFDAAWRVRRRSWRLQPNAAVAPNKGSGPGTEAGGGGGEPAPTRMAVPAVDSYPISMMVLMVAAAPTSMRPQP